MTHKLAIAGKMLSAAPNTNDETGWTVWAMTKAARMDEPIQIYCENLNKPADAPDITELSKIINACLIFVSHCQFSQLANFAAAAEEFIFISEHSTAQMKA